MKPISLALFATLLACDVEPADHEAPAAPRDQSAAFEDESVAARAQPAAARRKPDLSAMAARLHRNRELNESAVDSALHERLAGEGLLMVDPGLDVAVDEVRYALLPGALAAPPASFDELRSDPGLRGKKVRELLLGGEDSGRSAIFDNVAPGRYTVCVSAGPPADPARAQLAARAEAIYGDGPLDAKKLQAAVEQARAETGLEVEKTSWKEQPLRCREVEVTTQAASRRVALEQVG